MHPLLLRYLLSIAGFLVLVVVFLSPWSINRQSDKIQQEIDKVLSQPQ
ncbi:hypothetical protein SynBIOSU31_01829 [Synechococcus sp. BIOS-U3-1]|nr:hypothetical protein SynBIOSU31_01829 [Synechococcus sp. BIOS-U3-1]